MTDTPTLLGIFPHPDDESYTIGGTMALLAARGGRVVVASATRGERGQIADPALATPATLAAVRATELAAACAAVGAEPPRFLDFADGSLPEQDLPEAVGRIVRLIRAVRPHVVVTLGPDGVYGHPDHIALHRMVLPAFRSAGGGARFPDDEFGAAWQPRRLFWVAYPRGAFRPVWDRLLTTDLADGVRQYDPEKLGVGEADVHAVIDVSTALPAKLAAMAAHRTQIQGSDPYSIFPPGILQPLIATERFTLAEGERPARPFTDLFEGLDL